jgi:transcription elongation GreA/GreB family factor
MLAEVRIVIVQDVARVGSQVRVRDEDGDSEFELTEETADALAGRISVDSPLGKALLGHRPGDRVRYRAPVGVLAVLIVDVH